MTLQKPTSFPDVLRSRIGRLIPPAQAESAGSASDSVRAFREGVLNLTELHDRLRQQGLTGLKLARAISNATLARNTDLQLVQLTAYRSALRKGKMTPGEFILKALDLGVDQEVARIYAQLEVFDQENLPTRPSSIGLVVARISPSSRALSSTITLVADDSDSPIAGAAVELQIYDTAIGGYKTIQSGNTSQQGRTFFSILPPDKPGKYRYRASWAGTTAFKPDTSPDQTVEVTKP